MLASRSLSLMRVFAFDTASPNPSVAVYTADGHELVEPLPPHAAESLVACLRALAARANVDPRSADRIAILSGPGSFTGLRSGAAFARGFARALGVPFLSFSTFTVVSAALADAGDADFLLDAGRGDVHRARRRGETLTEDPVPVPRAAALEDAGRDGVPARELRDEALLLAPFLARLAARAEAPSGVVMRPVYGRPSAAEEKFPEALGR